MALNAEALECRAAAVQLQQEAKIALAKATEMEKRANDELTEQSLEMKRKQEEIERNRVAELERRVRLEEERQRLKVPIDEMKKIPHSFFSNFQELQIQQQERLLTLAKTQQQHEDEYANWTAHEYALFLQSIKTFEIFR